MKGLYALLVAILMVTFIPFHTVDISDAESIEEPFTLRLTDSEGNDLSDPLFGGEVTVFFDTIDIGGGTYIYKLKAMLAIKTVPANLLVVASGGLFKLSVNASGMGSFLDSTGMRISITDGDSVFSADLKKDNGYSSDFRNGLNIATLDPNKNYSVSICLIDGYESDIPPESVKNITFTFQAMASEGFHQVMFISEDETIESYMAFDNYVIEKVPSVSRSGYTFEGWFTPDGRQITDGYVISPDEGDVIAFAKWEKSGNNTPIILGGVGGGVGALALLLLLFAFKRKKDSEPK